jgi:signal transduction histidine kinase
VDSCIVTAKRSRDQFRTVLGRQDLPATAGGVRGAEGAIILDRDLHILAVQERAGSTADTGSTRLVGLHVTELWQGTDGANGRWPGALAEVVADGRTRSFLGVPVVDVRRRCDLSLDLVMSRLEYRGEPHVIVTFRESAVRLQLSAMEEEARRLQSLTRLAAGTAHDFNNFVCGIMNFAQLLEDTLPDGSAARSYAAKIRHTSERAAAVCRQLLDIQRSEHLEAIEVDINEVVGEIAEIVGHAGNGAFAVDLDLADSLPLVRGDPTLIAQAILNLCRNAQEAMSSGGRLTIATDHRRPTGEVAISVKDTGCGMSADVQARMFDPFYTTKTGCNGCGLGLTMTLAVADRHEGRLAVRSREGQGTEITLILPIRPQKA